MLAAQCWVPRGPPVAGNGPWVACRDARRLPRCRCVCSGRGAAPPGVGRVAVGIGRIGPYHALGVKNEALMEKRAGQAIHEMEQFNWQNLGSLAWALAELGVKDEALMEKLASEARRKMEQFKTQELDNLAWVFATMV